MQILTNQAYNPPLEFFIAFAVQFLPHVFCRFNLTAYTLQNDRCGQGYFDQLLGAARTQQLVELLFSAVFVRVAECPLLTKLRQQHMLNEKQF